MTEQLQAIERLIAVTPQPRWKNVLQIMRLQIRLPMHEVLDRVPGDSHREKLKAIGCSRTAFYEWLREAYRPNIVQAARLAKLTGLPADQIRGLEESERDTRATPRKTPTKLARSLKKASSRNG